jgi:hypothetical protein
VLRREAFEILALQLRDGLAFCKGFRHGLSVELGEFGLVVEGFEMGRAACHVEMDDAFCLRDAVRRIGDPVPPLLIAARHGGRQSGRIQQGCEGDGTHTARGSAEKLAPRFLLCEFFKGIHTVPP